MLATLVIAQLVFTTVNFDWDTTRVSRIINIAIFLMVISKSGNSTVPPAMFAGSLVLFGWSTLLGLFVFFQLFSDYILVMVFIGGITAFIFLGIGYFFRRFSVAQAWIFFLSASIDLGIFMAIAFKYIQISPLECLMLLAAFPAGATIFSIHILAHTADKNVPTQYQNEDTSQSER